MGRIEVNVCSLRFGGYMLGAVLVVPAIQGRAPVTGRWRAGGFGKVELVLRACAKSASRTM